MFLEWFLFKEYIHIVIYFIEYINIVVIFLRLFIYIIAFVIFLQSAAAHGKEHSIFLIAISY